MAGMAEFWDRAAREDAEHYVDDRGLRGEEFWRGGEEVVEAFERELDLNVTGGTVVEVGCGIGRITRALARRCERVVAVDVSAEMLDRARAENPGLDLWVYSPLVQGSFDRADRPFPEAYDHPGTTRRLAALRRVADARGVPASPVVLAWLVAQGWQPIVGVSSLAQLESALASVSLELTPEELDALGPQIS